MRMNSLNVGFGEGWGGARQEPILPARRPRNTSTREINMPLNRRDFMKIFRASVATLLVTASAGVLAAIQ